MIDILKSMAIFAEVAHLGSFRAAANAQGISPSVINRHISNLEDSLGEVLLSRSTRKLALTSVGEEFLVHCNEMLQSANEGLASVKNNSNQGHLRITLPITLVTPSFGQLIKTFRLNNPGVGFSFSFDDKHVDLIEQGVDVALRLGPLVDSNLKAKRVATVHRLIVASPEYLASIGGVSALSDLNRCSWIGRNNPATLPVLYSPDGEMHRVPKQSEFIQVNNIEAVKSFVLSHNGVGLLSDMLVEDELHDGKLIRLLPEWKVESMSLHAVWPSQKTTGQLLKKFVDFLSEQLDHL